MIALLSSTDMEHLPSVVCGGLQTHGDAASDDAGQPRCPLILLVRWPSGTGRSHSDAVVGCMVWSTTARSWRRTGWNTAATVRVAAATARLESRPRSWPRPRTTKA